MGFKHEFEPNILGFLCNWCCYAGADLAGVSRYQYPPNIRVIRVMCSGRVDPEFILQALSEGADGVFIGGCWLGECHYGVEGNYHALSMMHIFRKALKQAGINENRLRIEWVSASEGIRFAEVVTNFTRELKEMGPLGAGDGIGEKELRFRLDAIKSLIPQLKLVERERLRVHFETEEQYREYFASDDVERILKELVSDKLAISQIMALLRESPRSAGEISETLGIGAAELSRYLRQSATQGLIRFDVNRNLFAPALQ